MAKSRHPSLKVGKPSYPPSPTARLHKKKHPKSEKSNAKRVAYSILIVLGAVGVIALGLIGINLRLEAIEARRVTAELEPMWDSGRFFVGVQLKPDGKDTLYAFDPMTQAVADLGVLSGELIASVNPEKSMLFYLRKPVGINFGLQKMFGMTFYSANGVVIEPAERKMRVPIRSLPGVPLTVGFGVTGIWGGANDKIFLSLLKSPGNFGAGGYVFYGDGQTRNIINHVVFDLSESRPKPHFPIPARANLRDALFIGDDVWYAQAYPHRLGLTTIDAKKQFTLEFEDSISSLFQINENTIGIVSGFKADPRNRSVVYTMKIDDHQMEMKFGTKSLIRKERVEPFNRLLFFIQSELAAKPVPEERFADEPFTTYGLYSLPFDTLEREGTSYDADLNRVATLGKSGSAGFYDADHEKRTVIFRDATKLYEVPYEGGEPEELWMPPDLKLHWIQVIYCH